MRGNKRKGKNRTMLDDDDVAFEREYCASADATPVVRPTCPTGKVCIDTPGRAAAVAKEMRHKYHDPLLHSYHCDRCGHYHTGHPPGSQRMLADMVQAVRESNAKPTRPYPSAATKHKMRS
jgi:hypothetical protein